MQLRISDELYAALKMRSVRHDSSIAAELNQAANAGLEVLDGLDEIYNLLVDLRQFARLHLEPLTFIAAMDAASSREYWKNMTYQSAAGNKEQFPDPQKTTDDGDRTVGERASQRIQRALRKNKAEGGYINAADDGD